LNVYGILHKSARKSSEKIFRSRSRRVGTAHQSPSDATAPLVPHVLSNPHSRHRLASDAYWPETSCDYFLENVNKCIDFGPRLVLWSEHRNSVHRYKLALGQPSNSQDCRSPGTPDPTNAPAQTMRRDAEPIADAPPSAPPDTDGTIRNGVKRFTNLPLTTDQRAATFCNQMQRRTRHATWPGTPRSWPYACSASVSRIKSVSETSPLPAHIASL
jgi:hypothetical protein